MTWVAQADRVFGVPLTRLRVIRSRVVDFEALTLQLMDLVDSWSSD